uniref:Uncharacterized protein n=1 Tax=Anguilla anguilla TaxID=7936 RepID=A0A0E9R9Y3_ANGAN
MGACHTKAKTWQMVYPPSQLANFMKNVLSIFHVSEMHEIFKQTACFTIKVFYDN